MCMPNDTRTVHRRTHSTPTHGASTRGASTPGTVVGVDEDGLHISCGDGSVWVAEVQPAGKRRMDARAYAAGRAFAAGERLGVYGNT